MVLIALGSIALLLVLILKTKMHPFVALLLVSILAALLTGIPPLALAATIEEGMGKTLGHIALIIPLGAMIGKIIDKSGGAEAFAKTLVDNLGQDRTPLALTIAGFLIGIPIFFEVGVVMLMPMAYGLARTAQKPLLRFALPMCITLLIVHALLPPHPGPVAAAAFLGADLGRILLWGLPIAAATTAMAYVIASWMTRRAHPMSDEIRLAVYGPHEDKSSAALRGPPPIRSAPGAALILGLILLPIILIMLGTLAAVTLPPASIPRQLLTVLGTPFIALLLDVLVCAYCLGIRRGWSSNTVADVIGSAIPGVAMVILITGAGGIFAKVLVASGIGNAISETLRSTGLPVLGTAFVLTLLLRAAQGPTTVALIATAGIISPIVAQAGFNANQLALICVAMGSGGLACSHVNDAGFWFVTRLTGLSVGDGLRTWTPLTAIAGSLAFLVTALLWRFV